MSLNGPKLIINTSTNKDLELQNQYYKPCGMGWIWGMAMGRDVGTDVGRDVSRDVGRGVGTDVGAIME